MKWRDARIFFYHKHAPGVCCMQVGTISSEVHVKIPTCDSVRKR